MKQHKVYRDAVTGEYVTEEYAAEHPDTTVGEMVDTDDLEQSFKSAARHDDDEVTERHAP